MIALLVVGTMNSCIKDHSGVPVITTGNSRGCIECDGYEVGEKFSIDGVNYTVADRGMLDRALNNGADLTKFCTSKVTNMSNMFYNAEAFNQNISNWDVSNVTNMSTMFFYAQAFNRDLSQWCVKNLFYPRNTFSPNSPLTPENHPVWGTCP